MKKLLAFLLALVLLTPSALAFDLSIFGREDTEESTAASEKFEGPGFASPEEAALAYAEALKKQEAMAAISTFAIESYVEHADFNARAERLKVFVPASFVGMVPAENEYFRQVQAHRRFADVSNAMQNAYLNAIWDADLLGEFYSSPVQFTDEMTPAVMRESLARGEAALGFAEIEVLGVVDIRQIDENAAENYYTERNQENLARQCKDYGGDELADVVMQLTIGGRDYLQFMQCIRYGDTWYNLTPASSFAILVGLDFDSGGMVPLDALYETSLYRP